ncbi:MAG TPA: response regulator transcription factor [Candidatus Xenobia bacterium]|nr:response regulator transcription factor [Candidatus Xenobia bacterium]
MVLLPAQSFNDEACLRLLYLGIEGVLGASDRLARDLLAAVQAVAGGDLWAPARVLNLYKQQTEWIRSQEFHQRFALTGRENQVLQLMLRRLSNKEIGEALGISERTVKFHVSNILAKLHLDSRQRLPAALRPALAWSV